MLSDCIAAFLLNDSDLEGIFHIWGKFTCTNSCHQYILELEKYVFLNVFVICPCVAKKLKLLND